MRIKVDVLVALAAMAAALLAASCSSEPPPLAAPTSTSDPAPTQDATPLPTPAPTAEKQAAPDADATEEAASIELPVISDKSFELSGTQEWINSDPFTLEELKDKGEVALIDFWTYT